MLWNICKRSCCEQGPGLYLYTMTVDSDDFECKMMNIK